MMSEPISTSPNSDIKVMSFEVASEKLENIIRKLESGEASLEETLALYDRGVLLRDHCEKKLRASEKKVEIILSSSEGKAEKTEPMA